MTNIIVRSIYQTLAKNTYKILGMPFVENYNRILNSAETIFRHDAACTKRVVWGWPRKGKQGADRNLASWPKWGRPQSPLEGRKSKQHEGWFFCWRLVFQTNGLSSFSKCMSHTAGPHMSLVKKTNIIKTDSFPSYFELTILQNIYCIMNIYYELQLINCSTEAVWSQPNSAHPRFHRWCFGVSKGPLLAYQTA